MLQMWEMRVEDEEEGGVEAEAAEVGGDRVDPAGCQDRPGEPVRLSTCLSVRLSVCCLQTQEHELNSRQHVIYSLHTSTPKPLSSHLPKRKENLGDSECEGVVKFTVKSKISFINVSKK